jgi:hypothetical protein
MRKFKTAIELLESIGFVVGEENPYYDDEDFGLREVDLINYESCFLLSYLDKLNIEHEVLCDRVERGEGENRYIFVVRLNSEQTGEAIIKIDSHYDSWDGADSEESEVYFCEPKEVTVTVFEKVE